MRLLTLAVLTLLALGYVGGGACFFGEERGAETPRESTGRHPEENLAFLRGAFEAGLFSDEVFARVERFLEEAPSFYQSALLLAVYRANRVEDPTLVRRAFEAALRRFPANGRLHWTYAQWLLASRPKEASVDSEAVRTARVHLKRAAFFEEELTRSSLELLRWVGVPAEEWIEILPTTLPARRELLRALAGSGHRSEALAILRTMLDSERDEDFLREASGMALQWGDPDTAIDAARRWHEREWASGKAGIALARATLLLARTHLARGDTEAAYRVFHETLAKMEDEPRESRLARLELLNGMGYEYLRAGQTVVARSLFLKARLLAPYQADSALGLARTYRRAGDRKSAIEHYRRVLELEKDNAQAKKELDQLLAEAGDSPQER